MRKIKFALQMKDGVQARTLEELQGAFDLDLLLGYLEDGRLARWLDDRQYIKEAGEIAGLDKEDADLPEKLCGIFGIPYTEDMLMAYRYPGIKEIAKLLTISGSAGDLFIQISGSEKAIKELDQFFDGHPLVSHYRQQLSGIAADNLPSDVSADKARTAMEKLLAAKSKFIDDLIDEVGDRIFDELRLDGLSKLSNSGILTKPSKDSVLKVVEKLAIYREIIDAFDKAIQMCKDCVNKPARSLKPTASDILRLFEACVNMPFSEKSWLWHLSDTNRITWEVYDEYAKKAGMA